MASRDSGGAPHCGFCGRRFESAGVLFEHKVKEHQVFESECTRGLGAHGFLMVMVAGGRAHVLARGAAAEASLLPVDGWTEADTPEPVRRIVKDENRSLFLSEGGYLPKSQGSLEALEEVYHEMIGWTSTKVGELAPRGVRGGAAGAPELAARAANGPLKNCRACGERLTALFCEACGLKNE